MVLLTIHSFFYFLFEVHKVSLFIFHSSLLPLPPIRAKNFFRHKAPAIACEGAIGANDPMTRNEDRDAVHTIGIGYGAYTLG